MTPKLKILLILSSLLINRQGMLQAAHLIFRTLAYSAEVPGALARMETDDFVDMIGFWYDYSCLPQDPKTPAEAVEFAQGLQTISDMVQLPRVSTLVLRHEGDGYLGLGYRDQRDAVLLALLLLRSIVAEEATGDVKIWRGAIARFTQDQSLRLTRRSGELLWLD